MKNTIEIDGYEAVARFDPDIDMFRGEFVGLNGGADFYAPDVAGLGKEGAASLEIFLEMCEEDGVAPRRPDRPGRSSADPCENVSVAACALPNDPSPKRRQPSEPSPKRS